jgi:iron complex transport system substrate-binding protein
VVNHLQKLHITTLLEPPAASLDAAYQQIEALGTATGHSPAARALIARMRGRIAAIVRTVPRPRTPLSVYHELEPTFFSANSHTFIGQLYTLLGLSNIADGAHGSTDYPQLSAEYVIARDPDLIVLADTVCCAQTRASVAARAGWGTVKAVKNGNVVPVDDAIASEWGPRVPDFLQIIAAAVKRAEASQR